MNTANFGEMVRLARTAKGWSMQSLANESKVSSRTIFEVERGSKSVPRPSVVVKLAIALEQSPRKWLEIAGHKQIAEKEIQKITKQIGGFRFTGEVDTKEFFEQLSKNLNEEKNQVTICAAYPCIPSALHREDVQKFLLDRLETGRLKFAMLVPYPEIKEIRQSKKPHLATFYRSVQDEVFRLAKELHERLDPKYKQSIMFFIPKAKEHYRVMPNLTLSEYRTALIKCQTEKKSEPPKYELVTWATVVHDGTDRVIRLYPSTPELSERANNLMMRWKDYFSEVFAYCDGDEKSRKQELVEWECVEL